MSFVHNLTAVSNIVQNFQLHGISKELKGQTQVLKGMSAGIDRIDGTLADISGKISRQLDLQQQQLLVQRQQQQLMEKREAERHLQKETKNTVFLISKQTEEVSSLMPTFLRYLRSGMLLSHVERELQTHINHLEEIADKEYASKALKRLQTCYTQSEEQLTPRERADLRQLEGADAQMVQLKSQGDGLRKHLRALRKRLNPYSNSSLWRQVLHRPSMAGEILDEDPLKIGKVALAVCAVSFVFAIVFVGLKIQALFAVCMLIWLASGALAGITLISWGMNKLRKSAKKPAQTEESKHAQIQQFESQIAQLDGQLEGLKASSHAILVTYGAA